MSAKRPVEHGSRGPGAGDQSPSRGTGPVLLRAARLLEAFSHDRPTLTLSELARRSGLPLTTAYRLVADLVACGFLERDEHDLYHIGLKLWEIASLAPQRESLRDAALPFMEDLFQVTSENVQLAVREGEESVFVERLSGHRSIPVINRVGGRLPLHPTGVGRVLLAFAPQDVQEKVLASPLKSFSPLTVTSPVELRRILADVRARGFAVNDRQVDLYTFAVGAPIRGANGEVVAALSIVVPAEQASVPALAPIVQATARAISRSLARPEAAK
ncbi:MULTISPECIES: IclR family transcriptional regulator [Streptomyces]|uniref:IclR family transcriptional regulator n=1 Tax=Streptomyces sp. 900129855 TaxID=3155129 RepID=A0ABV2ZTN4_9ACTN